MREVFREATLLELVGPIHVITKQSYLWEAYLTVLIHAKLKIRLVVRSLAVRDLATFTLTVSDHFFTSTNHI